MSSTGPPRNYCGALKTNLKTCVKGTKLRVYSRASGWNGRRHARCDVSGWNGGGGIPNAICVQVEYWRRRNSGCDGRLGGMAVGGIPDAMRPDGMNMVVSSMKDGYELYGHGGLGEWF